MRKRRRLANKMTIMVCAVLLAVSAFFYASMDVNASNLDIGEVSYSENLESELSLLSSGSGSLNVSSGYYRYFGFYDSQFDFSPYMTDGDGLYQITFQIDTTLSSAFSPWWYGCTTYFQFYDTGAFSQSSLGSSSAYKSSITYSANRTMYTTLEDSTLEVSYKGVMVWGSAQGNPGSSVTVNASYSISNISVTKVNSSDSSDYQNGYNAGYSAGEQAGYGNGYSQGFTDGEASVDTDVIYDEAFQAGKDSVDTQSYYDAGYQAGYQVAYSDGYESGYDVGYQSAMDRIESWGADTSDYPILVDSGSRSQVVFEHSLGEDYCLPFDYHCFSNWYGLDNFNVDANHTYKFEFWFDSISEYDDDWVTYSDLELFANIGGFRYSLSLFKSGEDNKISIYISGDRMSDSMSFEAVFYGVCNLKADSHIGFIQLVINNLNVAYYDMGPSGDTQNHIANQTDQLTNGYDDSKGNQVNSDLSTGLNDYESAENSLFATATTGMKDFTFFDFESVPAMITGMSFIGSIMGSWFNQAGGASGVGIVLSILFSVILVAMVLGLYRWYQSRGGKN